MPSPPEDRSPLALAYAWAARVITIAIAMVVPGVLGVWVDQWLGTVAVFTLLGFGLGMWLGIWRLVSLTRPPN